MAVLYSNNAASTLTVGISDSDTSLTVSTSSGAEFPDPGVGDHFYVTLIGDNENLAEVVKVTSRTNDTMTIIRGVDDTAARAFNVGDKVELRMTKAVMDDIQKDSEEKAVAMAIALG